MCIRDRLNNPELKQGEIYLTPETEVYFTSSARKVAGTAIPVFSLRSEKSFGVGDFGKVAFNGEHRTFGQLVE